MGNRGGSMLRPSRGGSLGDGDGGGWRESGEREQDNNRKKGTSWTIDVNQSKEETVEAREATEKLPSSDSSEQQQEQATPNKDASHAISSAINTSSEQRRTQVQSQASNLSVTEESHDVCSSTSSTHLSSSPAIPDPPPPSLSVPTALHGENLDTVINNLEQKIKSLLLKDETDKATPKKSKWRNHDLPTALIYDDSMSEHRCLWDPNHEECPERFIAVMERIKELALDQECLKLKPRPATKEEVLRLHSEDYYNKVYATEIVTDEEWLENFSSKYEGVYFHPSTYRLAMLAAGCAIELVDNIVTDQAKNGMAVVRPPGHHAMEEEASGYCFFNNVAIAARHAIDVHNLDRILIVDWDVHHGQGTQYLFYEDPRVLYFSIHRYEKGAFWPELIESNYSSRGRGLGLGFNVNVPLNEIGVESADYLAIWHNLLLPLAYEFNPQLVIVSAGYDAAIGCPEGEMCLSPATYPHLLHALSALSNGRLAVVLEGGYCIRSLAESAALTLRGLLNYPCPRLLPPPAPIRQSVAESILDCIWAMRPLWKSLVLQGEFDRHHEPLPEGASGDQIINEQDGVPSKTDIIMQSRYCPVVEYKGKAAFMEKPEAYKTRGDYPVHPEEKRLQLAAQIQWLVENTDISVPQGFKVGQRTALGTYESMLKHRDVKSHPERPDRLKRIQQRLTETGLWQRCHQVVDPKKAPRQATKEELLLVHSEEHIKKMEQTNLMSLSDLNTYQQSLDSIYLNRATNESALVAAGTLLQVLDTVVTRKTQNGFALIRPPGHHASRDQPAGFCFYNNIAIAAKYALKNYADSVKRILIVDWDVHHGDGTQSLVQDDDRILFISLHRYDYSAFYPQKTLSGMHTGRKNVINIPWNGGRMGDAEYLMAFFNLILPVAYQFDPDLVLISSGFDAAINDPLGEYRLSPVVFGHLTHLLTSLAGGRVVAALEGGYNLESISEAALYVVKGLLGDPLPSLRLKKAINSNAIQCLKEVIAYQQSFWPSVLKFDVSLPQNELEE